MDRERVKQLVSAAIDLPPGERIGFLRGQAGDDQALLNEALSLLDASATAEGRSGAVEDLLSVHGGTTKAADESTIETAAEMGAPETFGRYKVLERIGEGGMGIVYRAEQRSPMRREVVVKVIKLGMDTKLVIGRFEAERQALAMMDHPHIAKVFDAGSDGRGRPYFVMEYVKGTPILDYCDRNHLDIKQRLVLFAQVCQAIQHAHHKGIIHRDIKPSNILVSTQDGKPFAKVIDFGIAKAMNQRLTDRTLFTEHANMIGTPAYMSPEQADGNIDIDTRTDVYSLGVVLYELLTGNTPFDPQRLKKVAINEIARIIREEDPPRPSTRVSTLNARAGAGAASSVGSSSTGNTLASLAKARSSTADAYVKSLLGEVDWIVMKALEKDRARRYETPNAMAEDIERYLNGVAIEAAPPSWGYRARKFVRKYKAPLIAGGMLAALLVLGLAGTIAGLVQARHALAREQEATARESVARQDALLQAYIANIGAAQVAMQGESWPEARQRLEACPANSRGWEWQYLSNVASAPEFGFAEPYAVCQLSLNGHLLLCQNGMQLSVIDISNRRQVWSTRFKVSHFIVNQNLPSEYEITVNDCPAAIAADGSVAVGSDNQIVVLNPNGEERKRFKVEVDTYYNRSLLFSDGGRYLAYFHNQICSIYDATTGAAIHDFGGVGTDNVAFSHQEDLLLMIKGGKATTYETRTGNVKRTFDVKDSNVSSLSISPDGAELAIGKEKGEIEIHGINDEVPVRRLSTGGDKGVGLLAYSPDGKFLYCCEDWKRSEIWDVSKGVMVAQLDAPFLGSVRFSSDGSCVMNETTHGIWHWKRGDDRLDIPTGDANLVAFSPDGTMAVSLDDYRVRVWKTDHPSLRPVISEADLDAKSDGVRCLALGGRDVFLNEWSRAVADAVAVTLKKPADATNEEGTVTSPDGRWTASVAADQTISIRDNNQGKTIANLSGHEGRVRAMVFTPDGTRLLTGSDDCTVRFWDTQAWREVATMRHAASVTSLLFASDGSRFITALADKSIVSRDIRPYSARKAEGDAIAGEQKLLKSYVLNLVNGSVPWENLATSILGDATLSDVGKIAALAELHDQLGNANETATAKFAELRSAWITTNGMRAAAEKLELTRAVRKALDQQIDDLSPRPKELLALLQQWYGGVGLSPEQCADALAAAKELATSQPDDHASLLAYGVFLYRCGDYEHCIEVMHQAEALRSPILSRRAAPGRPAPPPVTTTDIDNDESFVAMSQFKLGKVPEATATLRKVLRDWGKAGNRQLVSEAAGLIDAATTQPVRYQQSPGLAAIPDAIYSGDLATLRKQIGNVVKLKGLVVSCVPTRDQTALNLVLDSNGDGVIVWIRSEVLANLPASFSSDVRNCDVTVSGTVDEYGAINPAWKGRLEITLEDAKELHVFGHEAENIHPLEARAINQPLAVLDVLDHDAVSSSMNSDRLIRGTVRDAHVTQAGNSLVINMANDTKGFQVFVRGAAFRDFYGRYQVGDARDLVGRDVLALGTVVDYQGTPEIIVTNVENVDLLANPTTAPGPATKP